MPLRAQRTSPRHGLRSSFVSDRGLVQRITQGDDAAFSELLARYRSTLYATAYAVLLDPEQVAAVVADAFEEGRRRAASLARGCGGGRAASGVGCPTSLASASVDTTPPERFRGTPGGVTSPRPPWPVAPDTGSSHGTSPAPCSSRCSRASSVAPTTSRCSAPRR